MRDQGPIPEENWDLVSNLRGRPVGEIEIKMERIRAKYKTRRLDRLTGIAVMALWILLIFGAMLLDEFLGTSNFSAIFGTGTAMAALVLGTSPRGPSDTGFG
jgi:succinate dehydrogenase/fumarate reductase cytochrome b subunit